VQVRIDFNPNPRIERVALGRDRWCYVIDDALLDPQALVDHAERERAAFREVDFNAYPGILLPAPGPVTRAVGDFFLQHVRRRFDARRIVHMHTRLALVTVPPQQLRPRQQLCHRDSVGLDPGQSIQASVLYLFRDASLGGTSFYEPVVSEREAAHLFHEADTLSPEAFHARYPIERGYMNGSNRYFRRIASVPARWNRLIFYDGSLLHSGDIGAPERLSADPRIGRLTLNGFFTCRRNAA
jgi:Family of unknown function (DUF6445)